MLNQWLGNAVTRRATKQIMDISGADHVLESVEQAIRLTVAELMALPNDFDLKIYQEPDFDFEVFLQLGDAHALPLSHYADGFRNMLYLVMDMVWRASQLNPWLTLSEISTLVSGVITIDEIDLHLHPRWQGKAIGLIQKLFPNVQFFITTHSPTVVANFENGKLHSISDNHVEPVNEKYFGKGVDSVLRNILHAPDRNRKMQNRIDALFRMIDSNAPETEIKNLLQSLIDVLGEDDEDIQTARALIDYSHIQ